MLRWRDNCMVVRRPRQVPRRLHNRHGQLRTATPLIGFWVGLLGDRGWRIASNRSPVPHWQRDHTLRPGQSRARTGTPRRLPPSSLSRPPPGTKCPGRMRIRMMTNPRWSNRGALWPLASLLGSPSRPSRRSVRPPRSLRTLRGLPSPRCHPSRRAWALVRTTPFGGARAYPLLNLRGKRRWRKTGAPPPLGPRSGRPVTSCTTLAA